MSTLTGGSATMIGKEVATLLAREIAKALHTTPTFMSGFASEGYALTIGNDTLASSVNVSLTEAEAKSSTVTSALSKEIFSFLKTDPIAQAVFKDAAQTGAPLTLTTDPASLQGAASAISMTDGTKISFHSVESLQPKHFG